MRQYVGPLVLVIFVVAIAVFVAREKTKKAHEVDAGNAAGISEPRKRTDKENALIAKIFDKLKAENTQRKSGTCAEYLNDVHVRLAPPATVALEDFFEGNSDPGSIGCNLWPHPGIDRFYEVLKGVREREDVQDVLVVIDSVDDAYDWPFSEELYVITSADGPAISRWLEPLKPDDVSEGWGYERPPCRTVEVREGCKGYCVWWD